tara:strand:+ start:2997 stop:3203 length:207 start_codon:yes stop_codon:yes gene_type:complete
MFIFPECGDKLVFKDGTKQLVIKEGAGQFCTLMAMWDYDEFEKSLAPHLERIERITPCGWTTVWPDGY